MNFFFQLQSRAGRYKFGFNGQEKVNEISGVGNHLAFDARGYDSRLGRWWSVDPLAAKYPNQSPYGFVGGNPILNREIDGRDYTAYIDHKNKNIIIKATYYTVAGSVDAATSAAIGAKFWNDQSGKYNYVVGRGKDALRYNVVFQLAVREVSEPMQQANIDRGVAAGTEAAVTPDKSSNVYLVIPDSRLRKDGNGMTSSGAVANVKESKKNTGTAAHEIGHTLGLGHYEEGILTEGSADAERSNKINRFYIEDLVSNTLNGTGVATGNKVEIGDAPSNFNRGKVVETGK